jgi:hypothetical protein
MILYIYLLFREEIQNLKEIIKIPRQHFKNLEKLSYEQILSQKMKLKESIKTTREEKSISLRRKEHQRSESTNIDHSKTSISSLKFPNLSRRRSRMSKAPLFRDQISPTTQRMAILDTLNDISLSSLQRSVEHTTFDSKINSPGLEVGKGASKQSLYSLVGPKWRLKQ